MAKLSGYTGSPFAVSFTCQDADGDPVALTGYSARSELRPSVNSATLTRDMAPPIDDPTDGVIDITVTDEVTATFAAGTYYFDVMLDLPSGAAINLCSGTIVFRQQVPRV